MSMVGRLPIELVIQLYILSHGLSYTKSTEGLTMPNDTSVWYSTYGSYHLGSPSILGSTYHSMAALATVCLAVR